MMRSVVGDAGQAHATGATWGAGCVQGDSGVKLVGPVGQGVPVPLPWPFLHRRSLQAVPWCLPMPLGTLLPCCPMLEEPRDGGSWGPACRSGSPVALEASPPGQAEAPCLPGNCRW